jgi:hypothetical protein
MMRSTLAALILGLSLPGLALGQSMGEVARKEAERREKNKKAGVKAKAYGDQDLSSGGSRPAPSPVPSAAAPVGAEPASASSSAPVDESEQRRLAEASWRQRVTELTVRRDKAKAIHEELSKLSLVQGEMYVDEQNRPVITSLADLRAKLARAKADWDAAEQALERLHEEARRANVPPGWLR